MTWIATPTLCITSGVLCTDGGDITDLTSLTDVLSIGTTTDVATSTGLAVFNRDVGVLAGNLARLGSANTSGQARDLYVRGDWAYGVTNGSGDDFNTFDISDPDNPT